MSTNERRPAGAASETSKGAGVETILPRRRNWREVFAPPTPVELLVIFGAGWAAAIVAVVR